MVILGSQTEDGQGTSIVLLSKSFVAKKLSDGELSSLDPEIGGVRNRLEASHSAVCNTNSHAIITRRAEDASIGLEFAVKELVKVLKVLYGLEDVWHLGLEVVEPDKRLNVTNRFGVVEFDTLLD